jgi:hypothetical protein
VNLLRRINQTFQAALARERDPSLATSCIKIIVGDRLALSEGVSASNEQRDERVVAVVVIVTASDVLRFEAKPRCSRGDFRHPLSLKVPAIACSAWIHIHVLARASPVHVLGGQKIRHPESGNRELVRRDAKRGAAHESRPTAPP